MIYILYLLYILSNEYTARGSHIININLECGPQVEKKLYTPGLYQSMILETANWLNLLTLTCDLNVENKKLIKINLKNVIIDIN